MLLRLASVFVRRGASITRNLTVSNFNVDYKTEKEAYTRGEIFNGIGNVKNCTDTIKHLPLSLP